MTLTTAVTAPRQRKSHPHRLHLLLLASYLIVWCVLALSPVDRQDWLLENLLAVSTLAILILTYRRFAFSDVSYILITVFMILHAIGAHYTYAKVPFGFWMKDVFDLSRNHFDRIVHFAFGFLLAYPAYELFLRGAKVRREWALFMAAITVISLSGIFEVVESWVAQIISPELGDAYLGTQGDVWDAQKDMTMAIIGALITVGLTYVMSKPVRCPEVHVS